MSVNVTQGERVRTESSSVNCHGRCHNTRRNCEESLPVALVDEVENLHQQNVFADLCANFNEEENSSIQKFVADMDQNRLDCGILGYFDPVLLDPQNDSLNVDVYQVPKTIRPLDMGSLTGDCNENSDCHNENSDCHNENSKQIISSAYGMGSGVQENLMGPSEQQLHRQTFLRQDEEALIQQIAQEPAIEEALTTLLQTENADPIVRNKSKTFRCSNCGKQFSTKHGLVSHSRIHTDERRFMCEQCAAQFKRKAHLEAHQRTHLVERPFQCEICKAGFNQNGNLSKHLSTHSKVRLKCEVCGKEYRQQYSFNRHREIHVKKGE